MPRKRTLIAIHAVTAGLIVQLVMASAAHAQNPPREVESPAEYSRASGGEIELISRESKKLSGTLGMTMASSSNSSGTGKPLKGYEATFGGSLVEDRIWFFAAAQRQDAMQFASAFPRMPEATSATEGKVIALFGDQHNLSASAGAGRQLPDIGSGLIIPSSFLSLHYTGIISSNMFFTANVSRHSGTQPPFPGFSQIP